jgi:hypothetical protein
MPGLATLQGITLDDVRYDMFSFLMASLGESPFYNLKHLAQQTPTSKDRFGWVTGSVKDWEKVGKYFEHLSSLELQPTPTLKFLAAREKILQQISQDLNLYFPPPASDWLHKYVRGIKVTQIPQRRQKLMGSPSPFLDSGFHFSDNPDVGIETTEGVRRANMVTLHLLSRGLSEIGGSVNGSYDQHYITPEEYMQEVFPRDLAQREIVHQDDERIFSQSGKKNEIMITIQERLIEVAKEWEQNKPSRNPLSRLFRR